MQTLRPPKSQTTKKPPHLDYTCEGAGCGARLRAGPSDSRWISDRDGASAVFTCPHCKCKTYIDASLVPWR